MSYIVKTFVRQIKRGLMTLEDVPERWRDAVRTALEEA